MNRDACIYHSDYPADKCIVCATSFSYPPDFNVLEYVDIDNRMTSLQRACDNDYEHVVGVLLAYGANPNALGSSVNSQSAPLCIAIEKMNFNMTRMLIQAGANVHIRNSYLLYRAIEISSIELAKQLLEAGIDTEAYRDHLGNTPLMYACAYSTPEMVELFIQAGANLRFENESWTTLMHYAALNKNPEIARILVRKGLDVNAVSRNRQTPLDIALESGRRETAQTLREAGGM